MSADRNEKDFFSSMMFGPREPRALQREPEPEQESEEEEINEEQDLAGASQLLQIIALIQAVAPIVDQVKPAFGAAKTYLMKKQDAKKTD